MRRVSLPACLSALVVAGALLGGGCETPCEGADCACEGADCEAPPGDSGPSSDEGPDLEDGRLLVTQLSGLWSGPARQTVLGDFPLMNMDLRAVGDDAVFGRVDLDADNNLRFAFVVEDHGEGPELVYRNGGYFQGILRDSRARLISADPATGTWRFCSIPQGCGYIDALFELDGDALIVDVDVRGQKHMVWDAARLEERDAPVNLLAAESAGAPDQAFPTLGEATLNLSWSAGVTDGAQVLVGLSTEQCPLNPTSPCDTSRWYVVDLDAGLTEASAPIEQLHEGRYYLNAVLDLGGDGLPSVSDYVSLPNQVLDVQTGNEATASLSLTIPIGG
jgi:hypothetical protein